MSDVTVVTPSIPPRSGLLAEAVATVASQTLRPRAHTVVYDLAGDGEAVTRNRGLFGVDTRWTAFLDDDDLLYPRHLELLVAEAEHADADLVYPWFDRTDGTDPLGWFGKAFTTASARSLREANFIPVTYLVKTEAAQKVGGFPEPGTPEWPRANMVDWGFLLRLLDADARLWHLPQRTWRWRIHAANTDGAVWNH